MMRTAFLVAMAWGIASGCGKDCDPAVDRPYCDGNVVVSCPEPGVDQLVGTDRWVSRACLADQVCISPEPGGAFCAAETSPSALCEGDRPRACESSEAMVWCSRGYVTGRDTCTSCIRSQTSAVCEGGFGRPCSENSDCGRSHVCKDGLCI
ncbi:MAG TPA: hypothetical protein DFS52_17110 [Myxococcales bacterium]|jgi:hypothetical protein|nr:hypothetical protein [Myxococcales bacterium]